MASPGLSIAWSDRKRGALARKRQELLDPGGFLLIAWLARARAVPQSHVPVRERRCAAAREAGRTLRTARDRDQSSVTCAAARGAGRTLRTALDRDQRSVVCAGGRGDPAGCACRKLCPSECAV